jgi:hypothetical protein
MAFALAKHEEDANDRQQPLMIWYGIEPAVAADPMKGVELIKEAKLPTVRRLVARRIAEMIEAKPENLIGDRAYDSDKLDAEMRAQGTEMISPHRSNRVRKRTQDGRRLRRYERRWIVDTAADANFADMYLHPQETSYNLDRLLAFVASAGLEFAGFSNPEVWSPARLLSGELLERAQGLSQLEQWSLVEELDPDISHFEFFLSHGAVRAPDWSDDEVLLAARGEINRCLWGWPATRLMGPDLMPLDVSEEGLVLMAAVESAPAVAIGQLPLDWPAAQRLAVSRQLLNQRVLLPVL